MWVSAFDHRVKHAPGSRVREAEGRSRGKQSVAGLDSTSHQEMKLQISDHVYKLQNGYYLTVSPQITHKNLFCPLLCEIERKVDITKPPTSNLERNSMLAKFGSSFKTIAHFYI